MHKPHVFFFCSSAGGHSGCFQALARASRAEYRVCVAHVTLLGSHLEGRGWSAGRAVLGPAFFPLLLCSADLMPDFVRCHAAYRPSFVV